MGRGDEVVVQHWFSVACIACTCASLLGESSWRLVDGENELPRPCQSRLLVLRYPGCVDVDMVLIVEGRWMLPELSALQGSFGARAMYRDCRLRHISDPQTDETSLNSPTVAAFR